MGSFVVMFRIEEAKVEVDSKKNLWLQSPSGAGLVGSLGGAGNGLCGMPLGPRLPRRWQMAETTGARGVCAKKSNPSNLHKMLHKSLLSFELMFESVGHREPRFVIPNEATGK